jgi:Zn-dependent protease
MILTLQELFDIVMMSLIVGYIFSDILARFSKPIRYEPLRSYATRFDLENLKFASLVTAPAIILHELGHKFVALTYGLQATFHAAYPWLGIGLLLKMMGTGFIFFVPAYVSILGTATHFQFALIAAAGPLVNMALWLGSAFALKAKLVKRRYLPLVFLTSRINMFLFIFNMIPIPGFDGSKVFSGLATWLQTIF